MRVLVVGATGGSGRATVEELLSAGHEVTAFARRPDALSVSSSEHLKAFKGDATGLTDAADGGAPFASPAGEARVMSISRRSVGRFLVEAAAGATYLRQSVALSGA